MECAKPKKLLEIARLLRLGKPSPKYRFYGGYGGAGFNHGGREA
jgi:hypothetical protein